MKAEMSGLSEAYKLPCKSLRFEVECPREEIKRRPRIYDENVAHGAEEGFWVTEDSCGSQGCRIGSNANIRT